MQQNDLNSTFWEAGIYLSQADRHFAPDNLRKEWEGVSKRNALEEASAKIDELKDSETDFLKAMNDVVATISDVNQPKEKLRSKMREFVVSWLLRGDLIAYAFEKPRRITSAPTSLPPHLWQGRIDWFDSSLSSQGLNLIEIRVLSNKMIETVKASSMHETIKQEKPVQPTKGRPTIQPQITAAYQAVSTTGTLDNSMSLKTVAEHVRLRLALDCPELQVTEDRPSYETIRRVISPLWKEHTKQ